MPSGALSNHLLLTMISSGNLNPTFSTASSGWTKITSGANGSGNGYALFGGVSGVASALSISLSTAQHIGWVTFAIGGWTGAISDIQTAQTTGSTGNIDPIVLTPTTGLRNYLWMELGTGSGGGSAAPTAASTNFGPTVYSGQCSATGGSTHAAIGAAFRRYTAASMDPDAMTNINQFWVALTVSIPAPPPNIQFNRSIGRASLY